ncbi:MAG: hypothetical protein HY897_18170 [Deltaproteobacteria bacterium]|nr:hypothetical protein [Deltaproteobacteria bacterium]
MTFDEQHKILQALLNEGPLSVDDPRVVQLLKVWACPSIDLENHQILEEVIKRVPKKICEDHCLIPIKISDGRLIVAMALPFDLRAIDTLAFQTGIRSIEPMKADTLSIRAMIQKYYG